MSLFITRLNEADVDRHIKDLIEFGEDPKTDDFWLRVRAFIMSFGDMQDRIRLVHWSIKKKCEFTGGSV